MSRPSVDLYEKNLALLKEGGALLNSSFIMDLQLQSHIHSMEQVNITAHPPDAFQKTLSEDDSHAYALSREVPNYVGMRFIMEYVRKTRLHLWARSIDDPSLLLPLPPNAALAPRGSPYSGGLTESKSGTPLTGACSRKIRVGHSHILDGFADAVAKDQVNILECAAQTSIALMPGRVYAFDELFDSKAYPFSKVGACCGVHQKMVQRQQDRARSKMSYYINNHKATTANARLLTKAKVKSTASTRPKKRYNQVAVDQNNGSHVSISSDKRRLLKSTHRFSSSQSLGPAEPSLPPPQIVEAIPELGLIQDDRFFESYNENESAGVTVCDVPVRARRYQDDPVGHFMPLRQEFLEEVLRWESRGDRHFAKKCRTCNAPEPRFRCRDGCMGRWMLCQSCVVVQHAYCLLHWIEEWIEAESYFRRTTLQNLGLRVQLMHPPGDYCLLPASADRDFTVIHHNGIHRVSVDFCHCGRGQSFQHRQQLMRNGWWPASVANPQTCASIACLRQFYKINNLSKVAVYEYYRALQQLSDNTGVGMVIDKRRVFMHIIRQFRHIQLLKRGGRGHVEDGVATTRDGQLALRCPACPLPGRNLPSDWQSAPVSDRFLYRLFVAEDANFRLVNTNASTYAKDPLLGDGWAYFVSNPQYIDYIKQYVHEADISTCSGFAAIFLANLKRVLGLRTTGVASICCSRHNLIRPNGVGDLQKGERFANMTYVLAAAIKDAGVTDVLHTYDVACVFAANLWARNATLPSPLQISISPDRFVSRVPKFHLPAHKSECHARQSLNFTHGAGLTHGETVEQNWSILNKAAAQTKPMGPGTRQGTLDDMIGCLNKSCIDGLETVLPKRMLTAIKGYSVTYPEYEQLHSGLISVSLETVEKWLQEEHDWQSDKTKPCPYEYHTRHKGLKEVELELELEEKEATASGAAILHECTPSSMIKLGLDIQQSQRLLSIDKVAQKNPTPAQQLDMLKRSRNLKKRIAAYRKKQQIYMPGLPSYLEDTRRVLCDDDDEAENIRLYLPSELVSARVRAAVCAPRLEHVKERLREGEAHESLEAVRHALRARTVTNTFRNTQVRGQPLSTRARSTFDKVAKEVHTAKLRYRYSRNAYLTLRGHGDWESTLRVLDDDDVRALNERALTVEEKAEGQRMHDMSAVDFSSEGGIYVAGTIARGETSRTLSWIWYSEPQNPSLTDPVQNEALRVEYLKSRARRDRHREEIRLLEEEMRRTIASFLTDAEEWDQRASARVAVDAELLEGLHSYATEQALIARSRAVRFQERWRDIRAQGQRALSHDFDDIQTLPDLDSLRELEELEDAEDPVAGNIDEEN
ncbi:hypothetical protein HDZ31DRAFT_67421 [Schizophyllum fasciatum]